MCIIQICTTVWNRKGKVKIGMMHQNTVKKKEKKVATSENPMIMVLFSLVVCSVMTIKEQANNSVGFSVDRLVTFVLRH